MDYLWPYTQRTLSDGVHIRTQDAGVSGWIQVHVTEPNGAPMFTGAMPVAEAFTEIPFLLDRARRFGELLSEKHFREAHGIAETADKPAT